MDTFLRFGADVIHLGDFAEFVSGRNVAIKEFLAN
jgi:hypothetical protein